MATVQKRTFLQLLVAAAVRCMPRIRLHADTEQPSLAFLHGVASGGLRVAAGDVKQGLVGARSAGDSPPTIKPGEIARTAGSYSA